jgi:hypothetical protein
MCWRERERERERENKVKSRGVLRETFMLRGREGERMTLLEGSHAASSRPSGGSNMYKEKDVRMVTAAAAA